MDLNKREVRYWTESSKAKFGVYFLASNKRQPMLPKDIVGSDAYTPIDFFDTLKEMTKDPSIQLLSELLSTKDSTTNIALLDSSTLSQVDKNKISKGYKELAAKDLVVRVKRGVYLINPRLSPPYADYYDTVYLRWLSLTRDIGTQL